MININYELEIIQKKFVINNPSNMVIPILMSETDEEINEVMDRILSSKKLGNLRVSNEVAWLLMGFGFNMATYSLRKAEQRYFNNGLIAIGIASRIIDLRDCIRLLSLYWDVFKQKGLSFELVISQKSDFSKIIEKFLERKENDKSLVCMGFILSGKGENIQYQVANK